MKLNEARAVFKRFGAITQKNSLTSLVDAVRLYDREMTAYRVEHSVNFKYRQTVVGTKAHRDDLYHALDVLGWQRVRLTLLKNPNDQMSRKRVMLTDGEHDVIRRALADAPAVPFEGEPADHVEAGCGARACGACKGFRQARVAQKIDAAVGRAKKAGRSLPDSDRVTAHLYMTVADWWELVEVLRDHQGPEGPEAHVLAYKTSRMFGWRIER